MNIQELEINKITKIPQARLRIETHELSQLMNDIKYRGLLQPIGILKQKDEYILRYGERRLEACRKLGWKRIPCFINEGKLNIEDFISDNLAENEQRLPNSPIELSRICRWLLERDYSTNEISVKLNLPIGRIDGALALSRAKKIPSDIMESIKYFPDRNEKQGLNIPVTVAARIASMRTSDKNIKDMFEYAKKNEITVNDIEFISRCIDFGYTLKQSNELKDNYQVIQPRLIVKKSELKKYTKKYGSYSKFIIKFINHELPIDNKLFLNLNK